MGEAFIIKRFYGGKTAFELFNLIAVTDASSLPTLATPNTLAIISDTPINKIIASSTQPTSEEIGDVWVRTKGENKILYLEGSKQEVEIKIATLYQYKVSPLGGESWVEVETYTYETGIPTILETKKYLLKDGVQIEPMTLNRCTEKEGYLYLEAAKKNYQTYCATTSPVDLTNRNFLRAYGHETSHTYKANATLYVWGSWLDNAISSIKFTTTLQVYSIDISSLSGSFYVGVYGKGYEYNSNTYSTKANLYDIWLE